MPRGELIRNDNKEKPGKDKSQPKRSVEERGYMAERRVRISSKHPALDPALSASVSTKERESTADGLHLRPPINTADASVYTPTLLSVCEHTQSQEQEVTEHHTTWTLSLFSTLSHQLFLIQHNHHFSCSSENTICIQ
ncbi:hypothetical protein PBY51_012598 [Eleginops maclovinus]|nr:hypothetical protein PBY51_012598 [Eleginops maclovinus]